IAEYPQANFMNHARQRERKLLVRKAQLRKLIDATHDRGVTLVPLQVHFRRGVAKIQIATAKGRKSHDKRQRLKQKAADREIREKWRR
ncbi:MAG: SsrA-binding protein, partial [Planctomycetota bacterium]